MSDEITGDIEQRMREWKEQYGEEPDQDHGTAGTGTPEERIAWAAKHFDAFMHEMGYCPHVDPHMADTPLRVARMYWEMFNPQEFDVTTFEVPSRDMVTVRDIPFHSLCAHHWLPFIGSVSVGYIPNERLIGVSKIPRLIHLEAAAPQVQEQFTNDVRNRIAEFTETDDVAVVVKARHMCMELRGAKSPGEMVTSAMTGAFMDNPQTRSEFLAFVGFTR
jgi:GTP cyclohydrolase I